VTFDYGAMKFANITKTATLYTQIFNYFITIFFLKFRFLDQVQEKIFLI